MLVNPELKLDICEPDYSIFKFEKDQYFCIDGFPNSDSNCMMVMCPPMLGDYPYLGIKPCIIVVEDDYETRHTPVPITNVDEVSNIDKVTAVEQVNEVTSPAESAEVM